MKTYTKEQMTKAIIKRFEGIEPRCTSEFFTNNNTNGLWLKNYEGKTYTNKDKYPIVDTYAGKRYDIDVYIKFQAWCIKRGWYPDTSNYTLLIYPIK
jgi:hypothetical protein